MNLRTASASVASIIAVASGGCSAANVAQSAPDPVAYAQQAATVACPTPDSTDAQERAAATLAFNLMKGAAQTGGPVAPVFSNTILAPQRYRIQSSGVGIQFDPNDPLYKYVTNSMQAALAFAQLDATVAKFLSDGLNYAYANSTGWFFPSIGTVQVLANFNYPNATSMHIADNTSQNNSHQASVVGAPWCGTEMVTILDTVQDSYTFAPLADLSITNPDPIVGGGWLYNKPSTFHGSSTRPYTPFNGPSANGNPYLVVSVNGSAANWASYSFASVDCWNLPNAQCSGTIQIDPVPYAEPGAYYDTSGSLVGTQASPFQLQSTVLYATPDHASQWATRTVSGVQEWGTFSTATTLFGVTEYKYVKQM